MTRFAPPATEGRLTVGQACRVLPNDEGCPEGLGVVVGFVMGDTVLVSIEHPDTGCRGPWMGCHDYIEPIEMRRA